MTKGTRFASFLALLFTTCFVLGAEVKHLVEMKEDSFDAFINENRHTLVTFKSKHCGHCEHFMPVLERAAEQLAKLNLKLGVVDVDEETKLAERFEAHYVPHVVRFRNGKPAKYEGGRDADEIVNFMRLQLLDMPIVVSSLDAAVEFKDTSELKYVLVVPDLESELAHAYRAAVDELRGQHHYFLTTAGAEPGLYVLHADEEPVRFEVSMDEELREVLAKPTLPLFGPINGLNYAAYTKLGRKFLWFSGSAEDYQVVGVAVREALRESPEEFSAVWLDSDAFGKFAQTMLKLSHFPGFTINDDARLFNKYVKPSELTAAELREFFAAVEAGNWEQAIISEEPRENAGAAVQYVVGKNFDDLVYRGDAATVLFVFESREDGEPPEAERKLRESFDKVAKQMRESAEFVFLEVDAAKNDVPYEFKQEAQIYVTLPAAITPKAYSGGAVPEELVAFLEQALAEHNAPEPEEEELEEEL